MSNNPSVSEIRQLIENIDEQKYRIAFMYQYLIGGRVSEIGGKYKPIGNDAFLKEFNIYDKNIQAVIFKIKTARNDGKLRLCAIPLDGEDEPWAKIVYNYFKDFDNDCPFIFVKKGKLEYNDGKIMLKAREIFGKYKQEMKEYHNEDGKILKRRKKFTSDGIRKLRIKNLRDDYNFSDEELKIFNGLDKEIFIHPYGKEEIPELLNATKKYFNKLIIPLSELKKERYQLILNAKNADELKNRISRAITLGVLINGTNNIFELKRTSSFFLKDNSDIIIELFKSCDNKEEWLSRITNLSLLFDGNEDQLRQIVKKAGEKKSIKLIEQWLIENKIDYKKNMIKTWLNIKKLRNWTPIHYRKDVKTYQELLNYFGIRVSTQINYFLLWDAVLDKFLISLKLWQKIVDDLSLIS